MGGVRGRPRADYFPRPAAKGKRGAITATWTAGRRARAFHRPAGPDSVGPMRRPLASPGERQRSCRRFLALAARRLRPDGARRRADASGDRPAARGAAAPAARRHGPTAAARAVRPAPAPPPAPPRARRLAPTSAAGSRSTSGSAAAGLEATSARRRCRPAPRARPTGDPDSLPAVADGPDRPLPRVDGGGRPGRAPALRPARPVLPRDGVPGRGCDGTSDTNTRFGGTSPSASRRTRRSSSSARILSSSNRNERACRARAAPIPS